MIELKEASKDVLLTDAQRHEVASARLELSKALDDMVAAISNNQTLQKKADKLKGKGGFSAAWGSISGSNDRDLANMMKELGSSLETTQKAVQVVLRLQSRKDHVLREFQIVLIDKIHKMQADTHTLDAHQQAAVDVLCEFQEQIEDQLRHHEAVDRHELKINDLIVKLDQLQIEAAQWFQSIENQNVSLKKASDHLSDEFDFLRQSLGENKRFFSKELAHIAKKQIETAKDLASVDLKRIQDVTSFNKKIQNLTDIEAEIIKRTELIENIIANQSSIANWLKRNTFSIVSLLVAGLALFRGYPL